MNNEAFTIVQAFSQTLEQGGSCLEDEKRMMQEFRQSLTNLPEISQEDSENILSVLTILIPEAHAQALREIASVHPTGGHGIRHVQDVIEDIGKGSEDFLTSVTEILEAGPDEQPQAFQVELLRQDMIRYIILKRLQEQRAILFALIDG